MLTHTLGFPRIGRNRELKKAVEGYWKGTLDRPALEAECLRLRKERWEIQREAGVDIVPVGDFPLYDHMLDAAAMLGSIPSRYGKIEGEPDMDTRFRMARGDARPGSEVTAMEMTKWFDTNYHYIVPEFEPGQTFRVSCAGLEQEITEARAEGFRTKAVIPGPFTFLALGKSSDGLNPWELLDDLAGAYATILERIGGACEWIQLDEPVLATDLPDVAVARFTEVYDRLLQAAGPSKVMLATYFGAVTDNLGLVRELPLAGLHLDLVRAPEQLAPALDALPGECALSLGVVDGRNIWRTDLDVAAATALSALDRLGPDRILLAPSCSLLHAPVDLDGETGLDPEIRSWMAFGVQKCRELRVLADHLSGEGGDEAMAESRAALKTRRESPKVHNPAVGERLAGATPDMAARPSPYAQRAAAQRTRLGLPELPTTTIGSFPQTVEVRRNRRMFRTGEIDRDAYEKAVEAYIADCIRRQEEAGLDVLVHGEPERNDMVEYFGEQLEGFLFTGNGWVQSYGTRCVKPPVIYGDVSRPEPMTVRWTGYARSLSKKPVKGMLTGPVTILSWSFVRDDQPREETCRQIALAIRDEVCDLEQDGTAVIQVDEPAFREGLPLRGADRPGYLEWAVECFRLATSGVADDTQIHTHMCYAEFNEIIEAIAAMDADVISIEASRSGMELLKAFGRFKYPNEVGPGVWDIHSPRVPSVDEMAGLLHKALEVIPRERLWVNPDCGLKTRDWPETEAAMKNMVEAARLVRSQV